ncbi:MAG TPA: alkaline phosphatase family protein, partial [Thermoanaerobaculia bacterium]|nr:alkaline phosphatase family protein [Thermoanaerobaculia bacterium]
PRQPGYTPALAASSARARRRIWQAVDRGLARLLAALDLSTTTVVLASDHGMLPIHTRIDLNVLLRDAGLAVLGDDGRPDPARSRALALGQGGAAHVYLAPSVVEPERSALLASLEERFERLAVGGDRPIARVVPHGRLAEVGLDHPNSGDLVLFARPGYSFDEDPLPGGALAAPTATYGRHGHLHDEPRVQPIFLALGRGVPKSSLGTVKTVEVAGRVAAWLGIEPPRRASFEN